MERRLKKYNARFDFVDYHIDIIFYEVSEEELLYDIREELMTNEDLGAMAIFKNTLINPKTLLSVEVIEIEDIYDDTI